MKSNTRVTKISACGVYRQTSVKMYAIIMRYRFQICTVKLWEKLQNYHERPMHGIQKTLGQSTSKMIVPMQSKQQRLTD